MTEGEFDKAIFGVQVRLNKNTIRRRCVKTWRTVEDRVLNIFEEHQRQATIHRARGVNNADVSYDTMDRAKRYLIQVQDLTSPNVRRGKRRELWKATETLRELINTTEAAQRLMGTYDDVEPAAGWPPRKNHGW